MTDNDVRVFADLGATPLANAYLTSDQLDQPERWYPLCAAVDPDSLLVRLTHFVSPETLFTDYAYFSSYSQSWLEHSRRYSETMVERFSLDSTSHVIEVASNDGYLLRNFVRSGIPALGIEPASNVAAVAQEAGIETITAFLGETLGTEIASDQGTADLVIGNNVLAHVPDLDDFVLGLRALLKPTGVLTMEFPHILRLIDEGQFDTIYHEHYSYFSLLSVDRLFAQHELDVFDVEELPTHGGSLRVFARRSDSPDAARMSSVDDLLGRERDAGLDDPATYEQFAALPARAKRDLLRFLIDAQEQGKTVAGYGAPAKGNTLLNYCGVSTDLISFTVDRNPHKQGLYLPGSHIPISAPERIAEERPDLVLILPWNLRDEITQQIAYIADWGGRAVVPIPRAEVLP